MTDRPDGPTGGDGSAYSDPQSAALTVFGTGLPLAEAYADLLTGPAVVRGLIGPREADRIWDRHLLNSAALAELLPVGARLVDVGSGAGLPGLALACARSDLRIDLVDTLSRRTVFLEEAVTSLGLQDRVRVVTGRAEDVTVRAEVGAAQWVTARAVAPLDRLVRWCLPLLESGGVLLAIKGRQAEAEVATHARAIHRAGGTMVDVVLCGMGVLMEPTRVVRVTRN